MYLLKLICKLPNRIAGVKFLAEVLHIKERMAVAYRNFILLCEMKACRPVGLHVRVNKNTSSSSAAL